LLRQRQSVLGSILGVAEKVLYSVTEGGENRGKWRSVEERKEKNWVEMLFT